MLSYLFPVRPRSTEPKLADLERCMTNLAAAFEELNGRFLPGSHLETLYHDMLDKVADFGISYLKTTTEMLRMMKSLPEAPLSDEPL